MRDTRNLRVVLPHLESILDERVFFGGGQCVTNVIRTIMVPNALLMQLASHLVRVVKSYDKRM